MVKTQGAEVFITHKSRRMAKFMPLSDKIKVVCTIEMIREMGGKIKFSASEIKEMIAEGRL
jgi:hypothetical protein